MRNTWLGNEQKFYPWHETKLFSHTPVTPKVPYDSKYSSDWHGMMLISNTERRSRSPVDKERHGSFTTRTVEPSLQDIEPEKCRKKLIVPEISVKERSASRKRYEVDGQVLHKNSHSPLNPLARSEHRSLTPEPRTGLRRFKESKNESNLLADKLPPKPKERVKQDFVSQISVLPGTVKIEIPKKPPGSIEVYRSRQLIRTEDKPSVPGKRQDRNANEQWRSSFDIIKHVINTKSYY